MKGLLRLTKFNINYYLKPRFDSKKDKKKFFLIGGLLVLCMLFPLAMVIGMVYMCTQYAVLGGVVPEFLSVLFFSTEIMVIVLGMTTYLNVMYFSRDNSILSTLPVTSTSIYISKLIVCLLSMLILSTIVLLPAMIAAAVALVNAGFAIGASYYLVGMLAIICVPLLPLLLIAIFAFPVMKIVTFLKKRPVLMGVVTTLFSIGAVVAVWTVMFGFSFGIKDSNSVEKLVETFVAVGRFSYPTLILSKAMVGIDIGVNVAIVLAITLGCLAVGILFSVLLYRNTIQKLGEGNGAKRVNTTKRVDKKNSAKKALFMREMRVVMRNPNIFMQTLMMIILAPILVIIMSILSVGDSANGTNSGLFVSTMIYFYITLMMSMNYLALIGISRERQELYILKTMPVDAIDIIKIKLFLADIVSIIGVLLSVICFGVTARNVAWYNVVMVLIMGVMNSISINCFALYRDIKKPNLKWINPRDITKNNFSVMIPAIASIVPGILITIVGGLLSSSKLPFHEQDAIVWSILAIVNIVYLLVFRLGKVKDMAHAFEDIE